MGICDPVGGLTFDVMAQVVADRLAYPQASLQDCQVSKASRSKKDKAKFTIGIDLGGTKVAASLVDAEGRILSETRLPTVPPWMKDQDPRSNPKPLSPAQVRRHIHYVIDAMADAVLESTTPLRSEHTKPSAVSKQILGIGLASAGPMNLEKGTLDYPSNFRGWKVVPLVQLLKDALEKRGFKSEITFQNDAIAAALGEGWVGRAKGCKTYAMITVGTGIGTGVILNGRPAQSGGMGSEWGHMMVIAPGIDKSRESFNERSVEGLASGTGLIHRAKKRGFKGENAADLALAARKGNKLALELFGESAEALAALFYSLSLGFHPEKFVVAGGMIAIRDLFLPQAIEIYREMMKQKNPEFVSPIQVAELGNHAGVIGAARLPYLRAQLS